MAIQLIYTLIYRRNTVISRETQQFGLISQNSNTNEKEDPAGRIFEQVLLNNIPDLHRSLRLK